MGLKGYRLWVMGQLDFNVQRPTAVVQSVPCEQKRLQVPVLAQSLGVALQVEFERQTLKPVFHLIGYRLWV